MTITVAVACSKEVESCQGDSPQKKKLCTIQRAARLACGTSEAANMTLGNLVLGNTNLVLGNSIETVAAASMPTAAIAAAAAAVPPQARVSAKELADYYTHQYPFEAVWRWLGTGNGTLGSHRSSLLGSELCSDLHSRSEPCTADDVLLRSGGFREFAFTRRGGAVVRKLFFHTVQEWRAAVARMRPIRMDVGAVFCKPQFDSEVVRRELVFDVDANDYDDVRTPATGECGSVLGQRGWVFLAAAAAVIESVLRQDFGFRKLEWFFSGRRGIHCWVLDDRAQQLDNAGRQAIADYLSVDPARTSWPLHPAIKQRCARPLRFENYPTLHDLAAGHDWCVPPSVAISRRRARCSKLS